MTNEQINAAIAEACGWKGCPEEWSLTDDQLWRMARDIERNDEQWYFRATARQRAEAFLRTLGLWEEAK